MAPPSLSLAEATYWDRPHCHGFCKPCSELCTRTHTHAHAHTHARTHARTRARARAHAHTHTHAYVYRHARAHRWPRSCVFTGTYTRIYNTSPPSHIPESGGPLGCHRWPGNQLPPFISPLSLPHWGAQRHASPFRDVVLPSTILQ